MFSADQFVDDCKGALGEDRPHLVVKELLERAVSDGDRVAAALHPREGGLNVLYGSPELTVIHVVWAPGMELFPHDHRMWAAIGIYAGREDNTLFRRSGSERRHIEESGGRSLDEGDVFLLGDDVIHSVANPLSKLTGALHVYGGDFVNEPRSQWGPGPREERPFDLDEARQQFADANEAWRASNAG